MKGEQTIFNSNALMSHLLGTSCTETVRATLDFLDGEDLDSLSQVALSNGTNCLFFKEAVARVFSMKYLNRVDRSIFFLFYEDEDFLSLERCTLNLLASQETQVLLQALKGYDSFWNLLSSLTDDLSDPLAFKELTQVFFLEPDLPMPKFKRETVGMYCETGFQEHVCLLKFPQQETEDLWREEPLQDLRMIVEKQMTELAEIISLRPEEEFKRIREVRFCGFRMNAQNWQSFLIPNIKCHNLIVWMLGLCSQMVATFRQVIEVIEDPFMRFTEFALRANVYRNIVLTVEDKFSFVFKAFDDLCKMVFKIDIQYPQMNFWRPALSIWVQQMSLFHESNAEAYNYVISRLRENNLRDFLFIKTEKLPSVFSQLKHQVQLGLYSSKRKEKFYQQTKSKVLLEAYFEENFDMYETLAKDYIEYMVDISINQFNVHWCGHSEHSIKDHRLFGSFVSNIVSETTELYQFIRQVIARSVPSQLQLHVFRQVAKEDLLFSDRRLFKPCISKQIEDTVNIFVRKDLQKTVEFAIFEEQGLSKNKISLDFNEKDGMLQYFNSKHNITSDCPHELSFFYDIQIEDKEPPFLPHKKVSEYGEDSPDNLDSIEQYDSQEDESSIHLQDEVEE